MTTIRPKKPALRFSPTAWAKLLFLRDLGDTEIGGFAITSREDLLFVEEVQLVRQVCSPVSVEFADESVADFYDEQVDAGRRPEEFSRIWLHTHPGNSADPSGTDERTFERVFGRAEWAVMFILARGGQSYARLRYNVGPGADLEIDVEVEFGRPFLATEFDGWREEHYANVQVQPKQLPAPVNEQLPVLENERYLDDLWRDAWSDYADIDEEHVYGYVRDF